MAATTDTLLDRLVAARQEAGLFLDFDGVLAPIVARPENAYPPAETQRQLERLVGRYALVAVVSGRAGDDVRARVGVDGIVYVGTHGLELDPAAEHWAREVAAFAAGVGWPAADVEHKRLSVSFHFRNRADETAALRELERVAGAASDAGLVARFGRKVLEVLPPLGSNKGTAVRQLAERQGLTHALVAGDDTTDLDAFRAVDGLPFRIRVAVVTPESPAELAGQAELVLGSTGEFLELLRRL